MGGNFLLQRVRRTGELRAVVPGSATPQPADLLRLPGAPHHHDVHLLPTGRTLSHAELHSGECQIVIGEYVPSQPADLLRLPGAPNHHDVHLKYKVTYCDKYIHYIGLTQRFLLLHSNKHEAPYKTIYV